MADPSQYCTRCGKHKPLTSFRRQGERRAAECNACNKRRQVENITKVRAHLEQAQSQLALAASNQLDVAESREIWHYLIKELGGAEEIAKKLANNLKTMLVDQHGKRVAVDNLWKILSGLMTFERKEHETRETSTLTDEDIKREMAAILSATIDSPEAAKLIHESQATAQ